MRYKKHVPCIYQRSCTICLDLDSYVAVDRVDLMTKASRMRLLAILRSLVKLGQSWVELYRESLMDSAQPLSGSSAEAPAWYSNKNSNN